MAQKRVIFYYPDELQSTVSKYEVTLKVMLDSFVPFCDLVLCTWYKLLQFMLRVKYRLFVDDIAGSVY